jgi:hypothetical protein
MDRGKKVSQKLPYSSPTLWVHGAFEQLTQTTGKMVGIHTDTRGLMMDLRTS